ncbi:MAG: D-alanyl-D-alanine carboxypeptidase family protein [Rhodospirillaceae bacterium]|nr:D-alanyl-D-alanine carboxypeptidase family protein [Rhodospirillaceae bacterium]
MATVSVRSHLSVSRVVLGGLLALAFLVLAPWAAQAKYASIVVDVDTDRVLHDANADTRNHPASLTKMMTLYLLFEAMEQGRFTMDSKLKVSQRAAAAAPSKLGLAAGSTIAVTDAINALITKSANDVAVVVAENIGGSEARFAKAMTTKARTMGMRRTTFKNASGLPNKAQFSSARDMAILAKRLMTDFPQHYGSFGQESFTYAGQVIRSHNHMLANYDGADGLKTGYTVASGFNIATSARRDGRRLIGVVFGGQTARARDAHMADLLDEGFARLTGHPETVIAAPMLMDVQVADAGTAELSAGDIDEKDTPAPAPVKKRVAKAPAPQPLRTWGIQVGAYGARAKAEENANLAKSRLIAGYPNAAVRIEPAKINGRTLYRAQVVGLNREDTTPACRIADIKTKAGCKPVAPAPERKVAKR